MQKKDILLTRHFAYYWRCPRRQGFVLLERKKKFFEDN